MIDPYIKEIQAAAIAAYPKEMCGFITKARGFWTCKNIAARPKHEFAISKEDTLQAQGEGLLACVHSHPNGPDCPSAADMQAQIATGVPYIIVCTDGDAATIPFAFGDQTPIIPLVGRPFRHGVTDCYNIIRDYYRLEKGITIPEFPRDWEWWLDKDDQKAQSLYVNGFASAGFHAINESEVQEGDVFLAQIKSDTPNHGGIYLGNELILHHLTSYHPVDITRLSLREPMTRWRKYVTHWLRYEASDALR